MPRRRSRKRLPKIRFTTINQKNCQSSKSSPIAISTDDEVVLVSNDDESISKTLESVKESTPNLLKDDKIDVIRDIESIFYVERILDSKMVNGKRLFLLKWEGYSNEENTWEPEENVNSKDLIDEFLALQELKEAKEVNDEVVSDYAVSNEDEPEKVKQLDTVTDCENNIIILDSDSNDKSNLVNNGNIDEDHSDQNIFDKILLMRTEEKDEEKDEDMNEMKIKIPKIKLQKIDELALKVTVENTQVDVSVENRKRKHNDEPLVDGEIDVKLRKTKKRNKLCSIVSTDSNFSDESNYSSINKIANSLGSDMEFKRETRSSKSLIVNSTDSDVAKRPKSRNSSKSTQSVNLTVKVNDKESNAPNDEKCISDSNLIESKVHQEDNYIAEQRGKNFKSTIHRRRKSKRVIDKYNSDRDSTNDSESNSSRLTRKYSLRNHNGQSNVHGHYKLRKRNRTNTNNSSESNSVVSGLRTRSKMARSSVDGGSMGDSMDALSLLDSCDVKIFKTLDKKIDNQENEVEGVGSAREDGRGVDIEREINKDVDTEREYNKCIGSTEGEDNRGVDTEKEDDNNEREESKGDDNEVKNNKDVNNEKEENKGVENEGVNNLREDNKGADNEDDNKYDEEVMNSEKENEDISANLKKVKEEELSSEKIQVIITEITESKRNKVDDANECGSKVYCDILQDRDVSKVNDAAKSNINNEDSNINNEDSNVNNEDSNVNNEQLNGDQKAEEGINKDNTEEDVDLEEESGSDEKSCSEHDSANNIDRSNRKCNGRRKSKNNKDHNIYFPDNLTQNVQEIFQVEKILRVRIVGGKRYFLLKWEGFPASENTWEPEDNLECPELVEEFIRNQSGAKSVTPTPSSNVRPRTMPKNKKLKTKAKKFRSESFFSPGPTEVQEEDTILESTPKLGKRGKLRIAERVLTAGVVDGDLMFLIKWKDKDLAHLVKAERAYAECPQVCLRYFHERIFWRSNDGQVTEEFCQKLSFNDVNNLEQQQQEQEQEQEQEQQEQNKSFSSVKDVKNSSFESSQNASVVSSKTAEVSQTTTSSSTVLSAAPLMITAQQQHQLLEQISAATKEPLSQAIYSLQNSANKSVAQLQPRLGSNTVRATRGRPSLNRRKNKSVPSSIAPFPARFPFNQNSGTRAPAQTGSSSMLNIIKKFQNRTQNPSSASGVGGGGGAIRSCNPHLFSQSSLPLPAHKKASSILPNLLANNNNNNSSLSTLTHNYSAKELPPPPSPAPSSLVTTQYAPKEIPPPSPAPPSLVTTQYAPKEIPPPSLIPSPMVTTPYAPKEIPVPTTMATASSSIANIIENNNSYLAFTAPSLLRPAAAAHHHQNPIVVPQTINQLRGTNLQTTPPTTKSILKTNLSNALLNNIHMKSNLYRSLSTTSSSTIVSGCHSSNVLSSPTRKIVNSSSISNNLLIPTNQLHLTMPPNHIAHIQSNPPPLSQQQQPHHHPQSSQPSQYLIYQNQPQWYLNQDNSVQHSQQQQQHLHTLPLPAHQSSSQVYINPQTASSMPSLIPAPATVVAAASPHNIQQSPQMHHYQHQPQLHHNHQTVSQQQLIQLQQNIVNGPTRANPTVVIHHDLPQSPRSIIPRPQQQQHPHHPHPQQQQQQQQQHHTLHHHHQSHPHLPTQTQTQLQSQTSYYQYY